MTRRRISLPGDRSPIVELATPEEVAAMFVLEIFLIGFGLALLVYLMGQSK